MADEFFARLVKALAAHPPRSNATPTIASRIAAPRAHFKPPAPGVIDVKRAAAGDFDD
jgi:hypothetical protein